MDSGPDAQAEAAALACDDPKQPIHLYMWLIHTEVNRDDVNATIKIENASGSAIPLASVQVRYYLRTRSARP